MKFNFSRPKITRDAALWLLGFSVLFNEAFIQASPDPTLILMGGSLVGLPFLIGKDAKDKQ